MRLLEMTTKSVKNATTPENGSQKCQNVAPWQGDLQSHFHTCKHVKNPHFGHFWALGPIAIDSSRNFRSNGPGPIDFHEFSCDFGAKQGSTCSQHGF